LPSRCPPSPCGRLSRPRTTTRAPSHPDINSRQRACPPPPWPGGGEGNVGMVPTFTTDRSTGSVPSYSPAASPRVRRRPSSWPPSPPIDMATRSRVTNRPRVHCCPTQIHQVRAGSSLEGVQTLVPLVHLSVLLDRPGSSGSADPPHRHRGRSHRLLHSQDRAAPSFNDLLRQAAGGSFQPTRSDGASWRTSMITYR
jgi:hypothetical protein